MYSKHERLRRGWSRHGWWLHDTPEPEGGPEVRAKCGGIAGCEQCQADRAGMGSSVTRDQLVTIAVLLHDEGLLTIPREGVAPDSRVLQRVLISVFDEAGVNVRD